MDKLTEDQLDLFNSEDDVTCLSVEAAKLVASLDKRRRITEAIDAKFPAGGVAGFGKPKSSAKWGARAKALTQKTYKHTQPSGPRRQ